MITSRSGAPSACKSYARKVNRHLCGLCGKHFGDQWTLSHHQKTVHSDSREHKCGECDKAFLSNKDRVRHHRGVHLRERITFPGSGDRPRRRTSVTAPPSTSSDKLTKLLNESPWKAAGRVPGRA